MSHAGVEPLLKHTGTLPTEDVPDLLARVGKAAKDLSLPNRIPAGQHGHPDLAPHASVRTIYGGQGRVGEPIAQVVVEALGTPRDAHGRGGTTADASP